MGLIETVERAVTPSQACSGAVDRGDFSKLKWVDEVFFIRHADQYLIYAPLRKAIVLVNSAAMDILNRFQSGQFEPCWKHAHFFKQLIDAGLLVSKEEAGSPVDTFSSYRSHAFDPGGITLLLTTLCTMRCVYCYCEGGDRPRSMSWDTAKAAIDWIIEVTRTRGRRHFFVNFHGGGEVTAAKSLLKRVVAYARKQSAKLDLNVRLESGFNGVMSASTLDWVLNELDGATLSLDGLCEIHNAQRPMRDGSGSFEHVISTLKRMDRAHFPYGIRTTVTKAGLDRLPESVAFMARHLKPRTIQIEPFFPVGRALKNRLPSLDEKAFVAQFRKARIAAGQYHIKLKYSGARIHSISDSFCKACGQSFAVTPDGFVTSCYEVADPDDPRSKLFFYGRFDKSSESYILDEQRLAALQLLTCQHKPFCKNCFCKWHCAGDCPAKLALHGDVNDPSTSKRCYINRALTKDLLLDYLMSDSKGDV
jgi:uncharacterized protein